mgnify:FL=1
MSYYSSFTSNGLMVDHDIVPYKNLRNAIVIRACNDYKNALKKYAKDSRNPITNKEMKNIEKFFYSEYFMFLTDMPDYSECGKTDISLEPSCLLKFLRKEVLGDMDYDDLFKENNNVK